MSFEVKEIGSFHLGGREVDLQGMAKQSIAWSPGMAPVEVDPNGTFHVEQLYVQYVKLSAPSARFPLLLWHGGGHTGAVWETTPDGRRGWQQYFLQAGFDVFISDAVERGRASWARYPEVFSSEPIFRSKAEAWEIFRVGTRDGYSDSPAARRANDGQQFPVEAFDQFAMHSVPRWVDNDAPTQAAYNALIERVGPCVVIVHSQGGNFGFNAALTHPDHVKAVIALEPSGAPRVDDPRIDAALHIPHLFIWGDYLDQYPVWCDNIVVSSRRYHEALADKGAATTWMELPASGISGNSHMLMMDKNSDEIASIVSAWLAQVGAC